MIRHLNKFSLLTLILYGALTLVAAPLHHHAIEYVDAPRFHVLINHHADGCDVCTLTSASFTISISSESTIVLTNDSDNYFTPNAVRITPFLFLIEYPRRGPPTHLS